MRLFVTGATGTIGRRLVEERLRRGDEVWVLTRDAARARQTLIEPRAGKLQIVQGDSMKGGEWRRAVDGCDAVVNLAGAGVADKRWNDEYKELIRASRIESTRQVVLAIREATKRPRVLVNASAVGFYGERGDEPVTEVVAASDDYFGRLCKEWEAEADNVHGFGIRVVKARFGVVLDADGGALPQMARPFRFFVGGPVGNGEAYLPWVHWEDAVGAIGFALEQANVKGPVNVTSPEPARNRDFSRALGAALGRPSWLPMPRMAVHLVMGEVAKYALASTRAIPGQLQQFGYTFRHPKVGPALQSLLG
jgi:uncharacterized protein (TIGR01777 family)